MRSSKLLVLLVLGASILMLNACDPNRAKKEDRRETTDKKVCYIDAGGSFGKAGVRARQYIGKGPKMRVVQWKTSEFKDDLQIVEDANQKGKKPNIAIMISWRVSKISNSLESSLESIEAYSVNLKPEDAARVAAWRFTIFDGESTLVKTSPNKNGEYYDLFSTEAKGITIPGNVGEALGGVNGGRFEIALVDAQNNEVLKRFITPPRGYEFKNSAKEALDGLEALLANPENCKAPATQLRTN